MRLKTTIIAAITSVALVFAGVAYAATTITITSTAKSNKTGSKAKPASFVPTLNYEAAGADGGRPATPQTWVWKWNGVAIDGRSFPKCTREAIDAAQSDSGCPAGSLVAVGPAVAQLGPEGNPQSNVDCLGKGLKLYNAGTYLTGYIYGAGDRCAGVSYSPPFKVTLKTVGGTTTTTLAWPSNIAHPLPGVEGALPEVRLKFKDLHKKVSGKVVHFMSSTSCKGGTRKLSVQTTDTEGTRTSAATVGKCK